MCKYKIPYESIGHTTYPPVLVPPIISKNSQGLGGLSGSISSIKCSSISNDERPRMPPPSRESRHRPRPGIDRVRLWVLSCKDWEGMYNRRTTRSRSGAEA